MRKLIILTTKTDCEVVDLGDVSLTGEYKAIEGYRRQGWTKHISEYISASQTHITVMAREE